jgi:hypothetical protein
MSSRRRRRSGVSKRRKNARRNQMLVYGAVGLVVIGLIAVVAYLVFDQDPDIGEEFEDLGNQHINAEPDDYIWNTRPPTSGPHAPNITNWGVHTESVPEWLQVHNLEDGGIIIHYNCPESCPEVASELEEIARDVDEEMDRIVLHPYEDMDTTIAVTAWTRMITMDEVNSDQITEFIEAYRGVDHHR